MSKKRRFRSCPAAGVDIEAFECAQWRHTKFQCPESCVFNPFSATNYEDFLAIERSVNAKFLDWMAQHAPELRNLTAPEPNQSENEMSPHFFDRLIRAGFHEPRLDGLTLHKKWEAAGFPGLSHDE